MEYQELLVKVGNIGRNTHKVYSWIGKGNSFFEFC